MRKKILCGIAAIAFVGAFSLTVNNPEKGLSAMSLTNVNALAASTVVVFCSNDCLIQYCIKVSNIQYYGRYLGDTGTGIN
jgi:hypothetical protein